MQKIPHKCPRGRNNCIALSNMVADDGSSFVCCGENNGDTRPVEQDKYTVCFKGEFRDTEEYYDKRDLLHHSSVMLQAVAVVQMDVLTEERDWSPWGKSHPNSA